MKKMNKSEITFDFLKEAINESHQNAITLMNISGILAGFSLGSVIALLFINSSPLVGVVFILSLVCSWLFLISTALNFFFSYSYSKLLLYIGQFETIDDLYKVIKKHKLIDTICGLFWALGLLCFFAVLGCAGFFHSIIFGIVSSFLASLFILLVIKIDRMTVGENNFFDWD
jgi:hypothetical protein